MVTLVRLRAYWRFLRVLRQFLPLTIAYLRDRRRFLLFGGSRRVGPEEQRRRAEALLGSLLTLGPTFIKLGQLLSTRPDVLPPAYIDVLARLQDDVPPAPWEEARTVLEEELGPVDEVFDEFRTDPISGASLGQVYVATYDGQRVAVKVRRPGVESLVAADLRAVRWILPVILFFVDENRAFSMRNLADEFEKTIHEEMDYEREARMLKQIRANFEGNDRILMPRVVDEVSGERVLTMEYVGGTKITRIRELDRMGVDRSELARTLQRAYLQMMIVDGVFHADPHPGNLAVTEDGRIVFYDFGMSGYVEPFVQERIVDFYSAVASQDIDAILDTLVAMGTLSPEADRGLMAQVMEVAIQDARGEDVEQYRVQQIVQQVEDTIYEFPLRMPRDLALVLRVATVVEGVCVTLDEDFDFIEVATGFLRDEGYFEETARQRVSDAGQQLRRSAGSFVRVPEKLERTLDRIDRGNFEVEANIQDPDDVLDRLVGRIVYGLLVSVGGLSVALLYSNGDFIAAAVAAVLTLPVVVALYRSIRGPSSIGARPQFTRQNLRQQRREAAEAEGTGPGLAIVEADTDPGAEDGPVIETEPPGDGTGPSGIANHVDEDAESAGEDGGRPEADADPAGEDGGGTESDAGRGGDEPERDDTGSTGDGTEPTGDGTEPTGNGAEHTGEGDGSAEADGDGSGVHSDGEAVPDDGADRGGPVSEDGTGERSSTPDEAAGPDGDDPASEEDADARDGSAGN